MLPRAPAVEPQSWSLFERRQGRSQGQLAHQEYRLCQPMAWQAFQPIIPGTLDLSNGSRTKTRPETQCLASNILSIARYDISTLPRGGGAPNEGEPRKMDGAL